MTDQELKELIAKTFAGIEELKKAQLKTDEQLAKTDRQLAETDKQLAKTDRQLAETDKQLAKTDAQLAKTDRQLSNTDSKLNRICERYGNSENTKGQVAEEFFYTALGKEKKLGGIQYNEIGRNWIMRKNDKEEEYDIILMNGKYIAVIEVKYVADLRHVSKLEKKVDNFKNIFPIYKDFIIKGGLASMKINKEVEELLLEKNLLAITQKGNYLEIKGDS